jgi:hypothetical protein
MRLIAGAALVLSMIAGSPAAAELRDYNPSLLLGLQARGEPIILFVSDGKCDGCAAADASVKEIASRKGYEQVHVLRIDAVTQGHAAREYGARTQPTIIGLHGSTETGRTGELANPAKIAKVFDSTVR